MTALFQPIRGTECLKVAGISLLLLDLQFILRSVMTQFRPAAEFEVMAVRWDVGIRVFSPLL
jgi:hypothetical protein